MENQPEASNIKVICRFRPLNEKEKQISNIVSPVFKNEQTVMINQKFDAQLFTLDKIFQMESKQEEIFELGGRPVVNSIFEGFNGAIFAYGQTSSGKTHTMQGDINNESEKGLIPRIVDTIFQTVNKMDENIEISIKMSMVEIYKEKIRDLLRIQSGDSLKIREDRIKGIYIENVYENYVSKQEDIQKQLIIGNQNRSTAFTQMNQNSSRSHLLFMLTITQKDLKQLTSKTGKLSLVDLAGSEKINKTGAEGMALEEAKKINQSLSSLGNVINALTDGSQFIPYRNSKLTRILQESLGGNSKTTLIVTCSPSIYNETETMTSLRFGVRAKTIKNKPKINKELTIEELLLQVQKKDNEIILKDKKIQQLKQKLIDNNITDNILYETQIDQNTNTQCDIQIQNLDFDLKKALLENQQYQICKKELKIENQDLTEMIKLNEEQLQNQKDLNKYLEEELQKYNNQIKELNQKIIQKDQKMSVLERQYQIQQQEIQELKKTQSSILSTNESFKGIKLKQKEKQSPLNQSKSSLELNSPQLKIVKTELKKERQKNKDIEIKMIYEEEELRKKVNNLGIFIDIKEYNIEEMSKMYQQMMFQRQIMIQDYKNIEQQLKNQQEKNSLIIKDANFHKQKHDQLKSKYDQLKYKYCLEQTKNNFYNTDQQTNFIKVVQRQSN